MIGPKNHGLRRVKRRLMHVRRARARHGPRSVRCRLKSLRSSQTRARQVRRQIDAWEEGYCIRSFISDADQISEAPHAAKRLSHQFREAIR